MSKLRTPAFVSSTMRRVIEVPRAGTSSKSMPLWRFLNPSSISFLSSALAGIETTALPSFFAASTTFSHDWADTEAGDETIRHTASKAMRCEIFISYDFEVLYMNDHRVNTNGGKIVALFSPAFM